MKPQRGDVVLVAYSGDYGKVRPAVIVQADAVTSVVDSVIVVLATSTVRAAELLRIDVAPTPTNGLREPTQLMIEKMGVIPAERVRGVIGRLGDDTLSELSRRLAFVLGLHSG